MAEELKTSEQLLAEAEALYIEAALMLTKLDKKMRRAVKLVLVDKHEVSVAAAMVKRPRQNVYRALEKLRPKLEEVKAHGRD